MKLADHHATADEAAEEEKHTGPICKKCGAAFYYDYMPERHDDSGYCWICYDEEKGETKNG